ncbi:MAG: D-amino-acid transaminase [Candidatus Puniceispirillaceae bacterium]
MSKISYVNGSYVPHAMAAISIDDRGYQFGDGVYEVIYLYQGKMADEDGHLDRLERSLHEMRIPMPVKRSVLQMIIARLIRVNQIATGLVYIQVTRGVAKRDHKWTKQLQPALVITTRHSPVPPAELPEPKTVITVPDQRWERRDIKTIQLLPNCFAKQAAYEAGAFEAWMIDDDGTVTEGSSSNAWIVSENDELITRPATHKILNGITRKTVLKVAEQASLQLVERPFTLAEALKAKEAFLTSATTLVTPIGKIDDAQINQGRAGSIAKQLRIAYIESIGT